LEVGIGKVEPELQKHNFENFIFKAPLGAQFTHLHETSLQDYIDHDARIHNVLCSHLLIRMVQLSIDEEKYVLQCMAGS
jgi:hypothetical protein